MTPIFQPPMPTLPNPGPLWAYADWVPVGAVLPFAGEMASGDPAVGQTLVEAWGWMLCDGRELKVSEYPQLYDSLANRYGGASGGETFNIPDYRGVFLRGVDGGSGNDPDASDRTPCGDGKAEEVGSSQEHALQTHEHIYKAVAPSTTGSPPNTTAGAPASNPTLTEQGPTSSLSPPGDVKVSDKETRPINLSVHFIIKYAYLTRRTDHAMHT